MTTLTVKAVTHDDKSIQLPFTTMNGFKKSLLKSFSSFEVSEQILSIVTSAYDVVNGTGKWMMSRRLTTRCFLGMQRRQLQCRFRSMLMFCV
jgi:hypothetical protein